MNRPRTFSIGTALAAALLMVPASLLAQGDPAPRGSGGGERPGATAGNTGGGGGGAAVSRGDAGGGSGSTSSGSSWGGGSSGGTGYSGFSDGGSRRQAAPRRGSASGAGDAGRYGTGSDRESRVIPWYSRSRNGRPIVGTPAGREEVGRPGGGGNGYWGRPGWESYGYGYGYGYYGYSGLYPYWSGNCRSMYGFGAFGIGSFYYDPNWWNYGGTYGNMYGGCYGYGYGGYDPYYGGGGYYGGGAGGYSRSYADAGIKLKVKPANAQVFVDGYFAGEVDEFDGVFQRLPLAAGEHRVEIRAPGFTPLTFEVNLEPYQVINYKGELKRQ